MVGKAFSAVIKLDYVFDSPKTRLFILGKDSQIYGLCNHIF